MLNNGGHSLVRMIFHLARGALTMKVSLRCNKLFNCEGVYKLEVVPLSENVIVFSLQEVLCLKIPEIRYQDLVPVVVIFSLILKFPKISNVKN